MSSVNLPLNFKQLTNIVVGLPLFGFGFCVLWSFLFNYEASTKTHCEVDNFAPSISAAIGSFLPQKYVWQTCVCLHITPRFVYLFLYKHFYQTRLNLNRVFLKIFSNRILVRLAFFFNCVELLALLGLTLVSSQEDFDTHKYCFVVFGICGLAYFIITWVIWTFCDLPLETNEEINSLKTKTKALKTFLLCGLLMSYFYYRHNEFCEPYVYSLFCMCEYVIVGANMWFHYTASYDFAHLNVVIPAKLGYRPLPQ